MKKWLVLLGSIIMVLQIFLVPVEAGEMDILLEKLIEKGILSKEDAKEVSKEVKSEAKKERAAVVKETKAALQKDGTSLTAQLPGWIKNTKMKGDFRLRYQSSERRDGSTADRHRGRYRLRVGLVTKVNDKIKLHFGLATGGTSDSSGRSTNQTMDDEFDTVSFDLDYAYITYKACDWVELIGGKFKNPIWRTSGLLWDSDIRPEGFASRSKWSSDNIDFFVTTGAWIIEESGGSESEDPMMYIVQAGMKVGLGKNAYFKNAVTFYEFQNVEGYSPGIGSGDNPEDSDGLQHDYDAIAYSAQLGLGTSIDAIPFCALYGDAVKNTNVSDEDIGYLIGFKFGDKKVSKPKQWQAKMSYRRLEQNAWLDIFPNADFYGGETNVKGYHVAFKYGLMKNVFGGLNYFHSKKIDGSSETDQIFQADLIFKF